MIRARDRQRQTPPRRAASAAAMPGPAADATPGAAAGTSLGAAARAATVWPPEVPPVPVRRFSVDEYHRLLDAGILRCGDPYELLHGWIVPKMTANPAHAATLRRLNRWFQRLLGDEFVIGVQQPIALPESVPEPDLWIAAGPEQRYATRHPGPREVLLVVEVSDSRVGTDREVKLPLYASAKLPQYWLVDLVERRLEVYTQPRGGRRPVYRRCVSYTASDELPVELGGASLGRLRLAEIFP